MENNLIESIDRNRSGELPTAIKEAHPEAKKLLDREAINPVDFMGTEGYDDDKIRRDLAIVADLEKKFDPAPAKKAAEVLEAVMLNAELNNWFGQNSEIIKTSAFDDYINGVDMVAEFEESPNPLTHLGLAVDVTFGSNGIDKKFSRIKEEIGSGQLAQIKYFYSEKEGVRGPRKNLPRVVVGVEWSKIAELAGMWSRGEKKKMALHPAQRTILEEARL